jgi:hypothetical protein
VHYKVIRRMVRRGELMEKDHLLRLTAVAESRSTRLWTAVLLTGGWLSRHTAAGLIADGPGPVPTGPVVDITVRRGMASRVPEWVHVHSSRRLPMHHTTTTESGLPHTIPPRTFVDLAACPEVGDEQLVDWLDTWMARGALSLKWLTWFLEHQAELLPGRRRVVRILRSLGSATVDSSAERVALRLFAVARLPAPVVHHPVVVDGTTVAVVDFAWPKQRVALELDGYQFHSGPKVFVSDRRRGNHIELAGWMLLRTTPTEMRDSPQDVAEIVRRALGLRSSSRPETSKWQANSAVSVRICLPL